jgi:hypothetical protein
MQMSDPTEAPLSLTPLLDDSSADVTTQLAAADRTANDVDAFTPDATGEIEALDILEVVEVLRASRIPVAPVSHPVSLAPHAPPHSRADEVLETSRLPTVMIAPRPSVPSVPVTTTALAPSGHHPSSIAPLALDVSPPPPLGSYASDPSYGSATHAAWRTPMPPDLRESTLQIARAAGIPSRASRIVVFTASVGGMCLVAGILGVMLGYSHGPATSAQPMSLAAPGPVAPGGGGVAAGGPGAAPRMAVVTSAHEEITEGPILVPAKDAASIAADPLDELAMKPAPLATTPVVVASAARATPPLARPSSSSSSSSSSVPSSGASNSGTGVLRLPASVSGVLIDGVPHKAGGGGLVVTCGRHTVKAPGHPSRLVIVPCGGSAAL